MGCRFADSMWDRGSFKQLFKNHIRVTPQEWIKLDLPSPDEVPHLEMEVVNFHRPLLGLVSTA